MASALPDRSLSVGDEKRELRIAQRTDARCLQNMLLWFRRAYLMLPEAILWTWLARRAGAGWWALAWFAAWAGVQARVYQLGVRIQIDTDAAVQFGLKRTTRLFWAAGCLYALLFPVFFVETSVETKLTATLLAIWINGTVLTSCSGVRLAYAGVMAAPTLVLVAGWLSHGGVLGFGLAFMFSVGFLAGFVAVRQQRRSWEELVRLLDNIEGLVASLEAERDRAEAASASRTRFFAAASHDLRQPLHALSVNATTLELLARRADDAQLAELSQGISRALAQSQGLLDALLDISRLDAGAVQLRPANVDLRMLLRQLHAEFSGLAAQRGLRFALQCPEASAWAHTDADQLQRILRNLLDNAFKFTAEGQVSLTMTRASDSVGNDTLSVAVADTGCGIAPADRQKIFEEFYQVGNPARDRNRGLGLGLAIVRRTAELIGAQVRLTDPAHGRGTVFEVELPALDFEGGRATSPVLRASDDLPGVLSVLVVDDEQDILLAISGLLRAVGWRAHTADGSEAALALAGDEGPDFDVAVIDHRLPGCTGVELALQLRALRPSLPIVMVTGDVAVHWQVRRHGLRVLHKPLDGTTLTRAIAAAVAAATRWAARLDVFTSPHGGPIMNIVDAIHGRRSIRRYLDRPVAHDVIEDLIWHAAQVPRPPISDESSWAFHVVEGRERLAGLGVRAKCYAADHQPPGAPWHWAVRDDFEVFWGAPLAVMLCARRGHPEAPFDCCRAGQNLTLLAHARGLGTCWVGAPLPWLQTEEAREAVGLPMGLDASSVITLGYAADAVPGQSSPRPAISWCG